MQIDAANQRRPNEPTGVRAACDERRFAHRAAIGQNDCEKRTLNFKRIWPVCPHPKETRQGSGSSVPVHAEETRRGKSRRDDSRRHRQRWWAVGQVLGSLVPLAGDRHGCRGSTSRSRKAEGGADTRSHSLPSSGGSSRQLQAGDRRSKQQRDCRERPGRSCCWQLGAAACCFKSFSSAMVRLTTAPDAMTVRSPGTSLCSKRAGAASSGTARAALRSKRDVQQTHKPTETQELLDLAAEDRKGETYETRALQANLEVEQELPAEAVDQHSALQPARTQHTSVICSPREAS